MRGPLAGQVEQAAGVQAQKHRAWPTGKLSASRAAGQQGKEGNKCPPAPQLRSGHRLPRSSAPGAASRPRTHGTHLQNRLRHGLGTQRRLLQAGVASPCLRGLGGCLRACAYDGGRAPVLVDRVEHQLDPEAAMYSMTTHLVLLVTERNCWSQYTRAALGATPCKRTRLHAQTHRRGW